MLNTKKPSEILDEIFQNSTSHPELLSKLFVKIGTILDQHHQAIQDLEARVGELEENKQCPVCFDDGVENCPEHT